MKEPEVAAVLPHIDVDDFRATVFWLCWQRAPDGTGLNFTRADVLDMEYDEIKSFARMLDEARTAEDTARRRR